jgi:hypothetical protein
MRFSSEAASAYSCGRQPSLRHPRQCRRRRLQSSCPNFPAPIFLPQFSCLSPGHRVAYTT